MLQLLLLLWMAAADFIALDRAVLDIDPTRFKRHVGRPRKRPQSEQTSSPTSLVVVVVEPRADASSDALVVTFEQTQLAQLAVNGVSLSTFSGALCVQQACKNWDLVPQTSQQTKLCNCVHSNTVDTVVKEESIAIIESAFSAKRRKVSTLVAESEQLKIPRWSLSRRRIELASGCFNFAGMSVIRFLLFWRSLIIDQIVQPVCRMKVQKFDETTMKMSAKFNSSGERLRGVSGCGEISYTVAVKDSAALVKVWQLRCFVAVVSWIGEKCCIWRCPVPCKPMAAESNTSETTEAILDLTWDVPGLAAIEMDERMESECTVSISDRGAQNKKYIRLQHESMPERSNHFVQWCRVHMWSGGHTQQASICRDSISGLVAVHLTLGMKGMKELLVAVVTMWLMECTRCFEQSYPAQDGPEHCFRNGIYELYVPGSDAKTSARKATMQSGMNGNIESWLPEHHCPPGCCPTRESRMMLFRMIAAALVHDGIKLWPRHRWIGYDVCLNWAGLFSTVHHCAEVCIPVWLTCAQKHRKPVPADFATVKAKAQTRAPLTSSRPLAPMGWFPCDKDYVPLDAPENEAEIESAPREAAAATKFNDRMKKGALGWAESGPAATLWLQRVAVEPLVRGMHDSLVIAGEEFDLDQFSHQLEKGQCSAFRYTAGEKLWTTFLDDIFSLLRSPDVWMRSARSDWVTTENRCTAYRLLMRAGGFIRHTIGAEFCNYPMKLFLLTSNLDMLPEILAEKCRWCLFTKQHFRKYKGELHSKESLAELTAIFVECGVDISEIECLHAAFRRWLLLRSGVSHYPSLDDLASDVYMMRERAYTTELPWSLPAVVDARAITSVKAPTSQRTKKKRRIQRTDVKHKPVKKGWRAAKRAGGNIRRSGGAWRQFVHEQKAHRDPQIPWRLYLRYLGTRYRNLSDAERHRLRLAGQAATDRAKAGYRSFARLHRPWARRTRVRNISGIQAYALRHNVSNGNSTAAQLLWKQEALVAKQRGARKAKAGAAARQRVTLAAYSRHLGENSALRDFYLDSTVALPGTDVIERFEVCPPAAARTLEACPALQKEDRAELRDSWDESCHVLRGADFPSRKVTAMTQLQPCHKACYCLCADQRRMTLAVFETQFVRAMKRWAPPKTEQRDKLTTAAIVVKLSFKGTDGRMNCHQFFVCYTNLNDWTMQLLALDYNADFAARVYASPGVALVVKEDAVWENTFLSFRDFDFDPQRQIDWYRLFGKSDIISTLIPSYQNAVKWAGPYVFWRGAELERQASGIAKALLPHGPGSVPERVVKTLAKLQSKRNSTRLKPLMDADQHKKGDGESDDENLEDDQACEPLPIQDGQLADDDGDIKQDEDSVLDFFAPIMNNLLGIAESVKRATARKYADAGAPPTPAGL